MATPAEVAKVVMDEVAGRMEVVVPDDRLAGDWSPRTECPFGITIIWLVYRYSDRGRRIRAPSGRI